MGSSIYHRMKRQASRSLVLLLLILSWRSAATTSASYNLKNVSRHEIQMRNFRGVDSVSILCSKVVYASVLFSVISQRLSFQFSTKWHFGPIIFAAFVLADTTIQVGLSLGLTALKLGQKILIISVIACTIWLFFEKLIFIAYPLAFGYLIIRYPGLWLLLLLLFCCLPTAEAAPTGSQEDVSNWTGLATATAAAVSSTVGGFLFDDNKELMWIGRLVKAFPTMKGFRPGQMEILDNAFQGLSTIGVLPTGGGKSLIFQLLSKLKGTILVIIPTNALIIDQVAEADALGLSSYVLRGRSNSRYQPPPESLWKGGVNIVFCTPEYIFPKEGVTNQAALRSMEIAIKEKHLFALVIDECHLLHEWRFRESNKHLSSLQQLPVPIIALTATLTIEAEQHIRNLFSERSFTIHRQCMDKPNITHSVCMVKNSDPATLFALEKHALFGKRVIIYTATVEKARNIAEYLVTQNVPDVGLCLGSSEMTQSDRESICSSWKAGQTKVIVATDAFGVGINSPVERVIIWQMPSSISAIVQKAGRTGRNGANGSCQIYWSKGDVKDLVSFRAKLKKEPSLKVLEEHTQVLNYLLEQDRCRRDVLASAFGEEVASTRCICDNCSNPPQERDVTDVAIAANECLLQLAQLGITGVGTKTVAGILKGHTSWLKEKKLDQQQISAFGKCSKPTLEDLQLILLCLGHSTLLKMQVKIGAMGPRTSAYIELCAGEKQIPDYVGLKMPRISSVSIETQLQSSPIAIVASPIEISSQHSNESDQDFKMPSLSPPPSSRTQSILPAVNPLQFQKPILPERFVHQLDASHFRPFNFGPIGAAFNPIVLDDMMDFQTPSTSMKRKLPSDQPVQPVQQKQRKSKSSGASAKLRDLLLDDHSHIEATTTNDLRFPPLNKILKVSDINDQKWIGDKQTHLVWQYLKISKTNYSENTHKVTIGEETISITQRNARCRGVKICKKCPDRSYPISTHLKKCTHHQDMPLTLSADEEPCDVQVYYLYPEDKLDTRRWLGIIGNHNHVPEGDARIDPEVDSIIRERVIANPSLKPQQLVAGSDHMAPLADFSLAATDLTKVNHIRKQVLSAHHPDGVTVSALPKFNKEQVDKEQKLADEKNIDFPNDTVKKQLDANKNLAAVADDLDYASHQTNLVVQLLLPYVREVQLCMESARILLMPPICSSFAATCKEWIIDMTYGVIHPIQLGNTTKLHQLNCINVTVFVEEILRWVPCARILTTGQSAKDYTECFALFKDMLIKDAPTFSINNLDAILVDFSIAQMNGLKNTFGHEEVGLKLKGCKVHWMRSVDTMVKKMGLCDEDKELWRMIALKVPHVQGKQAAITVLDCLAGEKPLIDVVKFVNLPDSAYMVSQTNWSLANGWAKFWKQDNMLAILNASCSAIPYDTWLETSSSTNAGEAINHHGTKQGQEPSSPMLAVSRLYYIDRSYAMSFIAARKNTAPASYLKVTTKPTANKRKDAQKELSTISRQATSKAKQMKKTRKEKKSSGSSASDASDSVLDLDFVGL